jgi:asparagine synthase (glutamine-hydrolysing)
MCGIAGIICHDPRERPDRDRLVRMRDVLTHRGPDGAGLLVDGPVGLAHRRLAIIDVAGGHQPMSNEDGSVWIVYNGEIYNHARLRGELEANGHVYRTRTDTETILHLYEELGERVVDRLEGMFAFALWDRSRQRLLLARDRLGIKPLYYAATATELSFASEIKALLAAGHSAACNEGVIPSYLAMRFVPGEETFFTGVHRLLPGHVLTWSPGATPQPRRYWQVPEAASLDRGAIAEATDPRRLREELADAVERHLMSDVPLGVFLSGGIDSTALAALMAKTRLDQIKTFAVGFADREADERPYARLAASSIGAEHHDTVVTPEAFFDVLPRLVWHEDEPIAFASSVPLYYVARLASQHVKVVLTGEGADELFLGYNRYRVTKWNARFGAAYWAGVPARWQQSIRARIDASPAWVSRRAQRTFLGCGPGLASVYLDNFSVMSTAQRTDLLASPSMADPYDALLAYDSGRGDLIDRAGRLDLQSYLHELLMKQDQMSMAASVESRVPFLDDRLVARLASLPSGVRLPAWRTKVLLRRAVSDLVPRAILTRRKMGFPVPLDRWFRNGGAHLVDEFVLSPRALARETFRPTALRRLVDAHRSGRAAYGEPLWLLVNLEIWRRIFCDREDPAAVMAGVGRRRPGACHAPAVGQDGGLVAAHHRRPAAQSADRVAALPAP